MYVELIFSFIQFPIQVFPLTIMHIFSCHSVFFDSRHQVKIPVSKHLLMFKFDTTVTRIILIELYFNGYVIASGRRCNEHTVHYFPSTPSMFPASLLSTCNSHRIKVHVLLVNIRIGKTVERKGRPLQFVFMFYFSFFFKL